MKKKISPKIFVLAELITVAITATVTVIISTPLEIAITNIFNKSNKIKLEYQIVSDKILSRDDLVEIISNNFKELKIDFSMDDDYIDNYHLMLLNINNPGRFIEDDLIFDIDFCNDTTKILNVLGKLQYPSSKELSPEFEKPPLIFSNKDNILNINFSWNDDQEEVGFNVYRSYNKNVGFGQRNLKILQGKNVFKDTILKNQQIYYAVANFGCNGLESNFSNELLFPQILFNQYWFENTTLIDFNENDELNADKLSRIILQIKNALQMERSVLVNTNRETFNRWISNNEFKDGPIYFNNDFDFMHGRTKIHLNEIPKNAKYKIYIIYKTYSDKLDLSDSLKVKVSDKYSIKNITRKGHLQHDTNVARSNLLDSKRELLTPKKVRALIDNDGVIICWSIPFDSSYSHIRLFKSSYDETDLEFHWGEQIYEGVGENRKIICYFWEYDRKNKKNRKNIKNHIVDPFIPPPKAVKDTIPPGAPVMLVSERQKMSIVNSHKSKLIPFFKDINVTEGKKYTYTLVAYNKAGEYSLPIQLCVQFEKISDYPSIVID